MKILFIKALLDEVKEVTVFVDEKGFVTKVKGGVFKELCKEFECSDLTEYGVALPGFIDIHTHLRGLELAYKEDEESGTKAAARGGYTAIVDMPNTKPRINNFNALKLKLEKLNANAYTDFGVAISPPLDRDFNEFKLLVKRSEVVAVGELFPEELNTLPQVIEVMAQAKIKKPVLIHPEHISFISECEKGFRWLCRPLEAELKSLIEVYRIVSNNFRHIPIHITHATNPVSIVYAKKLGFTVDTTPHYIYLSNEEEYSKGCIAKVNPPLRHSSTRNIMTEYIGYVDAISTDHAPHSITEKSQDFNACPPGIASIEIAPSLMLNLVSKNVIDLNTLIRLLSLGPSKILGLEKWGCADTGCIASYTIVNLEKSWVIDSSNFYSKACYSPYDGLRIRGSVEATIIRGTVVHLNGEIVSKPIGKPFGCLNYDSGQPT
ncbi:dihydroorotase [Ignisphaera sp. 4213-co]|uniref:Dihydroorotase n=1 Tax=Ignisphaera cupida TaxID=3050454 RepID=A0ABD4Z5H6_9CREN|nr:dihydroorotase [Ignisphaera sp. 4213-co]MDK6028469.1 dihydroorotase [Ignisphaera sp. 4213-co]